MIFETMLALALAPVHAGPPPPMMRRMPDGQMAVDAGLAPRCREVELILKLPGGSGEDRDEIFSQAPCPGPEGIEPLLHLVIEGVDKKGRRLWLARGWDSRYQRAIMGPAGEGHGPAERSADRQISTNATFPVTRELTRLRWYEVNPGYSLRLIGESRWTARRAK